MCDESFGYEVGCVEGRDDACANEADGGCERGGR